MPKSITLKQINAINAKMSNGFHLDIRFWATHGEKQAAKAIQLDAETTLVATLTYCRSYATETTASGQQYNVPNGQYHIALHLAAWHCKPGADVATSHGLGQWISVSEDMPRRNFVAIQQLTAQYDDDTIMMLFDDTQHQPGRLYC